VLINHEDADEIFICDSVAVDLLKYRFGGDQKCPTSTRSGVGQMRGEKPCAVPVSSLANKPTLPRPFSRPRASFKNWWR
jgi:hypothetical protein